MNTAAKAWIESITLPTYKVGDVDTNPLFLENRVYQGSSGNVYPYGVIDQISDEKTDQTYQAVFIENDFIKIMLLPELGGRIHRAYDKVKQRDFVYYNEVVKPALVGLLGPWISGGIEFNWPQHHRPTTYMPVDFTIEHHDDGSAVVWMGEVEHMYGLQVMAGFKLYADKALIEITGKVYNTNETAKQFLWWSNPAVKGGDDHQSIFPPDVTAVYDHGKRDVSNFPIATGEYYKVDYSPGTDISRYKNIPVPTSYMADKSSYDFVGAYSHNEQGGLLHIADHHVSPGKKQWTWGNCDFGLSWDKNLTDENGPYIELMTGVYTDNQPDFTWIDSYEEKEFVQNFLPYSDLGQIHNANTDLAIKLERSGNSVSSGKSVKWGVYAIGYVENCTVVIQNESEELYTSAVNLTPAHSFEESIEIKSEQLLTLIVKNQNGLELIRYTEHETADEPTPDPASEPLKPAEVSSVEELYYIGQHLEQYHHATRAPETYYREGIKRDNNNYLCNLALASLAYNQADYPLAIQHCDAALARAHQLNKNPVCGKASFMRACAKEKLGEWDAAYADYYKATWSGNCRDTGFYGAAKIATRQKNYQQALTLIEKVLRFNGTHYQAMGLKALLLTKLDRLEEANAYIDTQLEQYPLAYLLAFQKCQTNQDNQSLEHFKHITSGRAINAIHIANFYISINEFELAKSVLEHIDGTTAMTCFYQAYLSNDKSTAQQLLQQAEAEFNQNVIFPNTLIEIEVLQAFEDHYFANYLLACFFYAKKNYAKAVNHWFKTIELNPNHAPSYRNLSVYHFNKEQDAQKALIEMEQAFALNSTDARVLFELDHLRKVTGSSAATRLGYLEKFLDVALQRDDLTSELLNLYNITGNIDKANTLLSTRIYHPWEGGEGRITGQYIINQQRKAFAYIQNNQYQDAIEALNASLTYPENLGEGRLVGQTDNDVHFWLGWCYQQISKQDLSQHHFAQAVEGNLEINQSRYYNDQPADYLFYKAASLYLTGKEQEASQIWNDMVNWARSNKNTPIEPDFFAVSLPDLIVFDSDLQTENQRHCEFVEAMGLLGLTLLNNKNREQFIATLDQLLTHQPDHSKANLFKEVATLIGEFQVELTA
ncbi:MAG: DUF5107 domain-containing protein [Vibrio sp.]